LAPETCPHEQQAVAWIQAELSADAARLFAEHLVSCEPCRAFLRDAEVLLQGLTTSREPFDGQRAAPAPRSGRPQPTRLRPWTTRAAVAALLLVTLVVFQQSSSETPRLTPASAHPDLAWIEQQLTGAGTWPAETTHGLRAQQIGLHSLSLIALTRGAAEAPSDERTARVSRAADWLVEQQNSDGSLGSSLSAANFDHVVGTRALLDAWALLGGDSLRESAAAALRQLSAPTSPRRRGAADAREVWRQATLARASELSLLPQGVSIPSAPTEGWDELALRSIEAPLSMGADLSPAPLISAALGVLRGHALRNKSSLH